MILGTSNTMECQFSARHYVDGKETHQGYSLCFISVNIRRKEMMTNARLPIACLELPWTAREPTAVHLDSPLRDIENVAQHQNGEGMLITVP